MRDVKLPDETHLLIIEEADINSPISLNPNLAQVRDFFESCRSIYDVIVVLVSIRGGRRVLPKWMRDYPLHPREGDVGQSFWIMEMDDETGLWKK